MKILVTGAKGFIGKNLVSQLRNIGEGKANNYKISGKELTIFEYDVDSDIQELDTFCREADFVFHLAGVNRPKDPSEFMLGNYDSTSQLLNALKRHENRCPVMLSSSIQATLDNPYGESKRAGEQLMFDYAKETGAKVLVYRFPNVFGKWCRPNYNSVIATFCNNIANDLPIQINDASVKLNLVYIDDVVDELIAALCGDEHYEDKFCSVKPIYTITLGEIVDQLSSFKNMQQDLDIPNVKDGFSKKLYSTYLSYLSPEKFRYPLRMNIDNRGSFTEIIRSSISGQFSVNISKPGITKGEHWHQSKNEKFVVVSGNGLIQMRKIESDEIFNFYVSGEKIEVVEMVPGYTHNIINLSDTEDLITFMWCNECFDVNRPDTFFEKVNG
ncbi:MAG: capsular polysaccharide biosynthesis protein CapF [Paludibacteraceae bacterium]|nr:capsular polysaccharide biosynthesis protein CapF [Paludibacteraceae bacterium]